MISSIGSNMNIKMNEAVENVKKKQAEIDEHGGIRQYLIDICQISIEDTGTDPSSLSTEGKAIMNKLTLKMKDIDNSTLPSSPEFIVASAIEDLLC